VSPGTFGADAARPGGDDGSGVNAFRRYCDRLLERSAWVLLGGLLVALVAGRADVAAGLLVGGAASLGRLWAASQGLLRFARTGGGSGARRLRLHRLAGYFLSAAALAIPVLWQGVHFAAVVGGLFLTNAVVVAEEVRCGRRATGRRQEARP